MGWSRKSKFMAKAIDFGLFLIFGTKWEASQEEAQWGRWQIVGPLVMNDDGNRGVRQNATKNENVGVTEWQVSWDSQTLTRKILDYNDLITNLFTILKRRKEKAVVFIWSYAYYLVHLSKQRACKPLISFSYHFIGCHDHLSHPQSTKRKQEKTGLPP